MWRRRSPRRRRSPCASYAYSELLDDRVGDLTGPDGARVGARRLHVVRDVLALPDDLGDRPLEVVRGRALVEVPEHQHSRKHLRHWVDLVLARVFRRGAVRRLEDRDALAEVPAGGEPEPADHSGAEIGEDVAVEVRQHEHVVLFRALDELHAHVVHDAVVELDVTVLYSDLLRDTEKQAVGELHDVGLVYRRHFASAVPTRIVEGELDDPPSARD